MKNKISLLLVTILFLVLLVVATNIINKQEEPKEDKVTPKAAIEVDESNFEEEALNSDKKVLIDFYATWCGPCKKLSPILEEVAGEHDEIKLIKIDVDKNEELSKRYGIEAMPTLVVLDKGEEIARSVGAIPKSKVLELIEEK